VHKLIPAKRLEDVISIGLRSGLGDDWLRVGHVKIFADGALGPRTAWMIAPYDGEPDNRGIPVYGPGELESLVARAASHGLACAIHAIGDQANRVTLDAFEQTQNHQSNIPNRIEHVQLLHPKDLHRLAKLGIVASMQPIHATQDMEMADRYWGERSALAYAWRSLLEKGTVLAFGSDCPVEDLNPFAGIHAAVTRRRADGASDPEGWYAEQRLTVSEAVYAYTVGAAQAAGVAHRIGSLAPGKLADLVVLDRDPFEIEPDEILGTRPLGTMIGGRWVHREQELADGTGNEGTGR
jgi:predicted amidohydrolase YtcJ